MLLLLNKAIKFATKCHEGQVRKYNNRPYITHPLRVAERVSIEFFGDENLYCIAVLHDVIEDCGIKREYLEEHFNKEIADGVYGLTNQSTLTDCSHLNRSYRKRIDRIAISKLPINLKIIKCLDRIDNIKELDKSDDFSKIYSVESFQLLTESLYDIPYKYKEELFKAIGELVL